MVAHGGCVVDVLGGEKEPSVPETEREIDWRTIALSYAEGQRHYGAMYDDARLQIRKAVSGLRIAGQWELAAELADFLNGGE